MLERYECAVDGGTVAFDLGSYNYEVGCLLVTVTLLSIHIIVIYRFTTECRNSAHCVNVIADFLMSSCFLYFTGFNFQSLRIHINFT